MKCKKILFFVITIILILSLIGIIAVASEGNSHDSCVEEHFNYVQEISKNNNDLDGLYPSNPIGSCPYVAMSLLLSYYDAYWDDRFVPNDYETMGLIQEESGRIWTEFHFDLENDTWWTLADNMNLDFDSEDEAEIQRREIAYSQFIQDNFGEFFQMYLIHLAIEEGFHDGELEYGLNDPETVDFLEYYLYDICKFNSNQVTVHLLTEDLVFNTNQDLIDTAKNLIENGTPVIYGGYSFELLSEETHESIDPSVGGHYLFGYDVTEDENDIVLSKCWNGHSTTTFRTTEYNYISSIIWLEINEEALPHVCSDSYASIASSERYCVCEIYSDHPNHTHRLYTGLESCPAANASRCNCGEPVNDTHTYDIVRYSSTGHWLECACGAKKGSRAHNYMYTSINDSLHIVECECGYRVEIPHDFTYPDYHTRVCKCGYIHISDHYFNYQNLSDNSHLAICNCGYSQEETHNPIAVSYHYSRCACGYEHYTYHQYTYQTSSDTSHIGICGCGYSYERAHDLVLSELSEEKHAYLCICGYGYEESHNLICQKATVNCHRFFCICGYDYYEDHNFTESNYHTSECNDCRETVTTPHESEVYEQLSATQHLVVCGCGYEGAAPHIFTCVSVSASLHRATCICGYTTLEIHTFRQSTSLPRYESCISCGYTRDNLGPGGGNVQMGLKKDDENEETE